MQRLVSLITPNFQIAFFSVASVIYWVYLWCLYQGLVGEPRERYWYAAIGGAIFFPLGVIVSIWEKRRAAVAARFLASRPLSYVEQEWQACGGDREKWRAARLAEVQSWLVRKIEIAEAEAVVRGEAERPDHWQPADEDDLQDLQDFLTEAFTPEDELWLYDNHANEPDVARQKGGIAVVRAMKVKDYLRLD